MSLDITALTSHHARWSEARHAVLAGNLAHTDTTGARSVQMESFADALSRTQKGDVAPMLATTSVGHMSGKESLGGFSTHTENARPDLQRAMTELGQNRRGHELNTAISAAFHRFQMSVLRG